MFLRFKLHARCCAVSIEWRKEGMAIAANRPMMATTIMISSRVNPNRSFDFITVQSICASRRRHLCEENHVSDEPVLTFERRPGEKVSLCRRLAPAGLARSVGGIGPRPAPQRTLTCGLFFPLLDD